MILTEGAILLNTNETRDLKFEYYMGPSGAKVVICVSYEYMAKDTARRLLEELGMDPTII
jgi:hypothetical protein